MGFRNERIQQQAEAMSVSLPLAANDEMISGDKVLRETFKRIIVKSLEWQKSRVKHYQFRKLLGLNYSERLRESMRPAVLKAILWCRFGYILHASKTFHVSRGK